MAGRVTVNVVPTTDVDQYDEGTIVDATDRGISEPRKPPRRPFDWKLAIACLPIAVGVLLIGFGLATSITGDEATKLPDAIESISPVPDAVQVLAQTNIVVDLAEGYEGELTIDGMAYPTMLLEDFQNINVEPGSQVDIPAGVLFEPGNDTLTFTPGPDIEIDKFDDGNHIVKVVYWRSEVGRQGARSYTWTFNVV